MFSSINSKSTILKSTASSIQVIIDNNSEKETSYYQVNRSTDSLDELAQPPSPAVLKGPKVIWFNPKVSDPTMVVNLEDEPNLALIHYRSSSALRRNTTAQTVLSLQLPNGLHLRHHHLKSFSRSVL